MIATYAWMKGRPKGMDAELGTVATAFAKADAASLFNYLSPEEVACGVDREVLEHALEHLVKPTVDQLEFSHMQIQGSLDNVSGFGYLVFNKNGDPVSQTQFEISVVPDANGRPIPIVPVLHTAVDIAAGLRHYESGRGRIQGGAELARAEVISSYIESYKTRFPGMPLPGVYSYSQNFFHSDPTYQGGGNCTPIQELHDKMLSRVPLELKDQYEPQ